MATIQQTQIPFNFGPGRSINSILFGPVPTDVKAVLTGTPSYPNPGDFIAARNLEVLTTLDVKNKELAGPQQFNTQLIGQAYGVPQSQIDFAQKQADIRWPQILKGRGIDKMVNTAIDAGLAVIAAAWAFLGAQAAALLYTPAATLPAGVEGPVAPLTATETAGNYTATAITTSGYGVAIGQGAKFAVDIFGQKIGGALVSLFTGDIGGAIKQIVTPTPTGGGPSGQGFFASPSGGGGGGGGGTGYSSQTGQTQNNTILYGVIILGILGLTYWYMKRRR